MDVQVDAYEKIEIDQYSFDYLNYSGYKAYHNQGYKGEGITVALIDSGVNADHEALKGKCLDGIGFNWYTNKAVDDVGHGTACASIIAKITPEAKILPIKVISPIGGETLDVIKALEWLAQRTEKVDIVSMSLSSGSLAADVKDRYEKAIKALVEQNTIVIVSSGNTGKDDLLYPASFIDPVTVGAVDVDKAVAYFSTRSPEVDVCQVGVDCICANYQGGYCKLSGTSFSTPLVAGIAALLACKYKKLFGRRISEKLLYELLKVNTIDLDACGVDTATGAGFCTLSPDSLDIIFTIGSKKYTVNGKEFEMDVSPVTINNRTYLPVRYVTDPLGALIYWDGPTKRVLIHK